MTLWNRRLWFERSGDRYVFRPTVFSRGYQVSETEMDQLFRAMTRFNRRLSCEGLVVLAAVAVLLMSRVIETAKPVPWFIVLSLLGVGILAATGLARRDRLIARVLGGRKPDVPRLAFRAALTRPRPAISKQYALPVLRSVVVLFCLSLATVDGMAVYLFYLAHHSAQGSAGTAGRASEGVRFAAIFSSPEFWVAFGLFNAFLVACAFLLARELRRLSRLPELGPPRPPSEAPGEHG